MALRSLRSGSPLPSLLSLIEIMSLGQEHCLGFSSLVSHRANVGGTLTPSIRCTQRSLGYKTSIKVAYTQCPNYTWGYLACQNCSIYTLHTHHYNQGLHYD